MRSRGSSTTHRLFHYQQPSPRGAVAGGPYIIHTSSHNAKESVSIRSSASDDGYAGIFLFCFYVFRVQKEPWKRRTITTTTTIIDYYVCFPSLDISINDQHSWNSVWKALHWMPILAPVNEKSPARKLWEVVRILKIHTLTKHCKIWIISTYENEGNEMGKQKIFYFHKSMKLQMWNL